MSRFARTHPESTDGLDNEVWEAIRRLAALVRAGEVDQFHRQVSRYDKKIDAPTFNRYVNSILVESLYDRLPRDATIADTKELAATLFPEWHRSFPRRELSTLDAYLLVARRQITHEEFERYGYVPASKLVAVALLLGGLEDLDRLRPVVAQMQAVFASRHAENEHGEDQQA